MEWVNKYLTENDLNEIEQAVQLAEKNTSGEIVPVLVKESGTYQHVPAILFLMVLAALEFFEIYFAVSFVIALVIGVLLAKNGAVRRLLTFDRDTEKQVNLRAEVEFARSRIHKTKDNTGIMLFLSFEEHMAVVLADQGINQYHEAKTWNEIVAVMTASIKRGQLKAGIIEAVDKCGKILAEKFPKKEFDTDELSNRLVIKEN